MSLSEVVSEKMKQAMKSKDQVAVETYRSIKSHLQNRAIEQGKDLTEQDEIMVLSKEVKKRKESLEYFKKQGRDDLVTKEEKELNIIESFLPEPMSPEKLQQLVDKAIKDTGAESMRDMGKVMGAIMPQVKGRVDGKTVQDTVKQKLS
ncbi:MAG: GatB/YqeY domain-containing protein [bacterium]